MNKTTIIIIILAIILLAGGGAAFYFISKKNKKKEGKTESENSSDVIVELPSVKLPISDESLKQLAYTHLTEEELNKLQGWMVLILKARKKAIQEGTDKWKGADTEKGLLKSAIYQMENQKSLKSITFNEFSNKIEMLSF